MKLFILMVMLLVLAAGCKTTNVTVYALGPVNVDTTQTGSDIDTDAKLKQKKIPNTKVHNVQLYWVFFFHLAALKAYSDEITSESRFSLIVTTCGLAGILT